ncbi:maleylpyruvate isomerase family mycothiol-dependent enzyme [Streptomyces sp. NPDC046805]|uniref:maleylpyruvate isomerase family mycothiol-dependent enzyme n=1 Tax=Streptomyces sp. NPDC046805 TaxID=3155134 RepID=UPI0033E556E3
MEPGTGLDTRGTLPEGLGQAIRETAGDIAALLRGAADTGIAVPDSEWSVGEAAAHLALANELMAEVAAGHERPYGDGTPQSLAVANERSLAVFGERAGEPLAAMIVEQAEAFLDAIARDDADRDTAAAHDTGASTTAPKVLDDLSFNTPLGPLDRATFASYLLTHMLGHGYDLARALGRPHMIDRARVELCLPFLQAVMPRVADSSAVAGFTARYTLRIQGGSAFGVAFTDGAVAVTPEPLDRADCTILTEPVTFLLMALGRQGPWQALARGRVLSWGRKPWLAPRFPNLFTAP